MTDLVEYLNKAAAALYLAVDQVVADDLSPRLNEAATALEAQAKELAALRAAYACASELLTEAIARAEAAERERDEAREAQYLLDWFSKHPKLELSFGGWDEDHDAEWSVHSVGGSRNDREWTLLANRSTPLEAIRAARAITGKD